LKYISHKEFPQGTAPTKKFAPNLVWERRCASDECEVALYTDFCFISKWNMRWWVDPNTIFTFQI
jgi:hypothetical protein